MHHAPIQTAFKPAADINSHAYAHGFSQAFRGREFRNPCEGNPVATDNHYWGFIAGEAALAQGFESQEAYAAAISSGMGQ